MLKLISYKLILLKFLTVDKINNLAIVTLILTIGLIGVIVIEIKDFIEEKFF